MLLFPESCLLHEVATFHAFSSLTRTQSSSLCTAVSPGNVMRMGGQVHSQANSLFPAAYPSGNGLQIWPLEQLHITTVLTLQESLGIWSRVLLNLCLGVFFSGVQSYGHLPECSCDLCPLGSDDFLTRNISLCFRGWVFLPIWTTCNSASPKGMPDRGHTGPEWTIASTAIETVTGESHTLSGHRSQILDTDSELLRKPLIKPASLEEVL